MHGIPPPLQIGFRFYLQPYPDKKSSPRQEYSSDPRQYALYTSRSL
jgi:hypothetical protein